MSFNNSIEDANGIYFGSEGEFLGIMSSPMYGIEMEGNAPFFPIFCLNKFALKEGKIVYNAPPEQIVNFIGTVWDYWMSDADNPPVQFGSGYPGTVGIRKSGQNTIIYALHVANTTTYSTSDKTSVFGIKNKWQSVVPLSANADSPESKVGYSPLFNPLNGAPEASDIASVFAMHRITWCVIDFEGNATTNTATFYSGYTGSIGSLFGGNTPSGNVYINASLGSLHILHFFESGLFGTVEAQTPIGPSGNNIVTPPNPVLGLNYVPPVPLTAGRFGASIINGVSFELFTGEVLFPSQFALENGSISILALPEITENPAFFMATLSSSNALFNRAKSFAQSAFTIAPLTNFFGNSLHAYISMEPNAGIVIHSGNIQTAPLAKGRAYIEKSSFDLTKTYIVNPYASIIAEIRDSLYERLDHASSYVNTSLCNQNVFYDPSSKLTTPSDKNADLFLDIVQFIPQSVTMPASGSYYPVTQFQITTDTTGQTVVTPMQPFSYSTFDAWACSSEIVGLRNILVGSVPVQKIPGAVQADGGMGFPIQSDDKGFTYLISCAQDLFVSDSRAQKIVGAFLSSYASGEFLSSEQNYALMPTQQPYYQEQLTAKTANWWPASEGYTPFPNPLLSPFYLNFFVEGGWAWSGFAIDFYYRPFYSFDEDGVRYGFSIADLIMPYLLNGEIAQPPRIYEKINVGVRKTIVSSTPGAYMVSGKYVPQALKISKGK